MRRVLESEVERSCIHTEKTRQIGLSKISKRETHTQRQRETETRETERRDKELITYSTRA